MTIYKRISKRDGAETILETQADIDLMFELLNDNYTLSNKEIQNTLEEGERLSTMFAIYEKA